MPGRRATFDLAGAHNEHLASALIGRLSAPVPVPREADFGIDLFCQLFAPGGEKSLGVDELLDEAGSAGSLTAE